MIYIRSNKYNLPAERISEKLDGSNAHFKIALVAVAAIGTFLAVREWWTRRKLAQTLEAIVRARPNVEGLSDIQICVVCLQNPREIFLVNCGHVCVCADCVLQLRGKCPVCRSPIDNTYPAYLA